MLEYLIQYEKGKEKLIFIDLEGFESSAEALGQKKLV